MLAIVIIQILIIQIGGEVFGTVPLTITDWMLVVAIAFAIIPIDLIRKIIVRKVGIRE